MGMSKEVFLNDQDDRSGYDVYERLVHYRSLSNKLQERVNELQEYVLKLEGQQLALMNKLNAMERNRLEIFKLACHDDEPVIQPQLIK